MREKSDSLEYIQWDAQRSRRVSVFIAIAVLLYLAGTLFTLYMWKNYSALVFMVVTAGVARVMMLSHNRTRRLREGLQRAAHLKDDPSAHPRWNPGGPGGDFKQDQDAPDDEPRWDHLPCGRDEDYREKDPR